MGLSSNPAGQVEDGFLRAKDIEGVIATANHDVNAWGKVPAINLPMAPYRAERIRAVLGPAERLSVEDMIQLQFDLH